MNFEGLELSDEAKTAIGDQFNSLQTQLTALKDKNDELLTETKRAKDAKRTEEEERLKAEEQANLEKAEKSKDINDLKEFYESKITTLQGEIDGMNTEKKQNTINGIANEFVQNHVVDDPIIRNAISQDMAKRLDLRDGGTAVLDTEGNLTGLKVEDLQSEFLNNSQYAPHLVATNATGGGAGGSDDSAGGGSAKNLTSVTSIEDRTEVIKQQLAAKGL